MDALSTTTLPSTIAQVDLLLLSNRCSFHVSHKPTSALTVKNGDKESSTLEKVLLGAAVLVSIDRAAGGEVPIEQEARETENMGREDHDVVPTLVERASEQNLPNSEKGTTKESTPNIVGAQIEAQKMEKTELDDAPKPTALQTFQEEWNAAGIEKRGSTRKHQKAWAQFIEKTRKKASLLIATQPKLSEKVGKVLEELNQCMNVSVSSYLYARTVKEGKASQGYYVVTIFLRKVADACLQEIDALIDGDQAIADYWMTMDQKYDEVAKNYFLSAKSYKEGDQKEGLRLE